MIATTLHDQSVFRLWVKYRMAFPLKNEPFSTNRANYVRWKMLVENLEKNKALKTITIDTTELNKVREKHRVMSFDQFPEKTRAVYYEVAKCFPGFQVYACGSRVRGDYVDLGMPGSDTVLNARKKAGMNFRKQSDYDFWVGPGAVQVGELPKNTDRARLRIPENEKVAIPVWR